jgi:hypothetical protein
VKYRAISPILSLSTHLYYLEQFCKIGRSITPPVILSICNLGTADSVIIYLFVYMFVKKVNDLLSFFPSCFSFLCTPQPTHFLLVISLVQCKAAEKFVFICVSSERVIGLREIFSADKMSHYFRDFEKRAVGGDIEKKTERRPL